MTPTGLQTPGGSMSSVAIASSRAQSCAPSGPVAPEQGQQFISRFAVIERRNQRLNGAHRAIVSACIPPAFQIMSSGDVPVAKHRSFILIKPEIDSLLDFGEIFGKWNIRRGGIDRVMGQNDQRLNLAR